MFALPASYFTRLRQPGPEAVGVKYGTVKLDFLILHAGSYFHSTSFGKCPVARVFLLRPSRWEECAAGCCSCDRRQLSGILVTLMFVFKDGNRISQESEDGVARGVFCSVRKVRNS